MKQAVIKKGKVVSEEVAAPMVSSGNVLIRVVNSCISAGTEMSSVKSTEKGAIQKLLDKPKHLKTVADMVLADGLSNTYKDIKARLEEGHPTGYSLSGVVVEVGQGVEGFKVGDRVAAAGAGIANHATFVNVPKNLVMTIPDALGFPEASTVTMGGIALQGVRRADLRLGELCVVFGVGILGLLAIQMLRASGVRVIAIDLDDKRLDIAKEFGAERCINPMSSGDAVQEVKQYTGGYGVDAVLFTAATSKNEPLAQSFQMCRKKGKVVLVGVVGMDINREDMYMKELDFQISTSYGPGRYDQSYEQEGNDYPYAYVRWTENRNMTEYLRLAATGQIQLDALISAVYPIEDVEQAFSNLNKGPEKPLITLLTYGELPNSNGFGEIKRKVINEQTAPITANGKVSFALVGAGGFAANVLLPNFRKLKSKYFLKAVVNRTGLKAKNVAKHYEAAYSTTDYQEVLNDAEITLVVIATRHNNHAELVLQALKAGKNVFVEKPLAVQEAELKEIIKFYNTDTDKNKPMLFVGFNRRFSKYLQEVKKQTENRVNPMMIHYRMNAGYIPLDVWVHEDGGRIIGECCHLIDVANFLTGSKIKSLSSESVSPQTEVISSQDNHSINIKYEDGSVVNIQYFSVGNREVSKEYMEVHYDEKTIIMDDYKSLKGYGLSLKEHSSQESQKGHLEELEALYQSLNGKASWPIELWDMIQTTKATFDIANGAH